MAKIRKAQRSVSEGAVAPLATSGANTGFDRTMTITGRTTEGSVVSVASFRVVQPGLREPFTVSNGEEFQDANGETFGVLKPS